MGRHVANRLVPPFLTGDDGDPRASSLRILLAGRCRWTYPSGAGRPRTLHRHVVDRSTTHRTRASSTDYSKDGRPCQPIGDHVLDGLPILAKVRVAGSNPVVRSKEIPGQRPSSEGLS